MSGSSKSKNLIDHVGKLSDKWKKPLTEREILQFTLILSQHPDNFEKFKKLNRHLQMITAKNYLNQDANTPIFLYLDAIEATQTYSVPIDLGHTPSVWLNELKRFTDPVELKETPDFIRIVRWFDYHLGRGSTVILYMLRSFYGEALIVRMGFKLAELNCDVRTIDFVSLAKDWKSSEFEKNFNIWTAELYQYRSFDVESLMHNYSPIAI